MSTKYIQILQPLSKQKASLRALTIKEHYEVSFKYPQMNDVMRLVKEFDLEVVNTDFRIDCKLIFAAQKSKADSIVETFKKNHELAIKKII